MKRVLVLVVLALTVGIVSFGCSAESEPIIQEVEVTREVPIEVTREIPVTVETIREITIEVTREVPIEVTREVRIPVVATATRPAATATPSTGTSISNPHPLGEPFNWNLDGAGLTVTVTQVYRGTDAYSLIYSYNRFNDPPPAGFEYLLWFAEISYTGADVGPVEIDLDFQAGTISKGVLTTVFDLDNYVVIENELSELTLFAGGSVSGWYSLTIRADDLSPVIVFGSRPDDRTNDLIYISAVSPEN